ncbi:polyamine-transporting ATPase 13A3 isoform X2 [Nematostella vectensis]|uniref:polyamine-transporting ATPase 13A3 isoform X2 n=1 Tax=Nematostella vectensis TaxID=45351 RepID=UPI0020772B91|nr:polyamine-transporting ATPase 13A3 isoform X2 [Nematostella vectensis]
MGRKITDKSCSCLIDDGTNDELVCYGYEGNIIKIILYYLMVLCSGGFLVLVSYWRPDWKLKLTSSPCPLHKAKYVLLKTIHHTWNVERVMQEREASLSTDDDGNRVYQFQIEGNKNKSADLDKQKYREEVSRYFIHRHLKYMWHADEGVFKLLRALDQEKTINQIYEHAPGLSVHIAQERLQLYGSNLIDVAVKSYGRLFLEQSMNPFYIFQLFSILLWCTNDYYYYASAIFIMSLGSIIITIRQTKQHLVALRDMVAHADVVTVLRNKGVPEEILSTDLVPGDVVVIPPQGTTMHCDAALISGNCIVNESMLTGESVPVTKIPLPHHTPTGPPQEQKAEVYSPIVHKRHTLFNGTKVIQTRYYGNAKVLAVVIRTGFFTTKGRLIRSILNPRPVEFQFFKDSMRFISMLAVLASVGFAYSVYVFVQQGAKIGVIIEKSLDVITIAVPPALPAAMSIGMVYALQRLKKQYIYCIQPSRINMCGKLKLFCFDKTGTLTEDGLDLLGVVRVEDARFEMIVKDATILPQGPMLFAMATCHSLTMIDNELTGDPLDIKMFEATGWVFDEPGEDNKKFDTIAPSTVRPKTREMTDNQVPLEVGIIRQFPFSSDVQRMTVITRILGSDHMDVYVKGAPEVIASLCRPETVPANFQEELEMYTKEGYRVLGVAYGALGSKVTWHQAQRAKRDVIEKDLIFSGLLVLQNALKPESAAVIKGLQEASIRTVMVTGDNMLTAVSVGRECGMVGVNEKVILAELEKQGNVDKIRWSVLPGNKKSGPSLNDVLIEIPGYHHPYHIAVSGKTFAYIRENEPQLMKRLLVCGTVFARMSPEQKTHLVEELQSIGYSVGMCGDGANDCGALKAAYAGISLSEAEASIASPFTSKIPNIECVPKVIKEGRCALVTSFACFKYMALYSIVQFVSVLILYSIGSNLSDFQFLYIDLVIITSLALVMGYQHPYPILVSRRPGGSLVAPIVLVSLISQIVIQITVQVSGFVYVKQQSWYVPVNMSMLHQGGKDVQQECHDNTVIFTLSSFQYIILAVAFARGKPYRLPIYRNPWFLGVLAALSAFTLFLVLFGKPNGLHKFFELEILPSMSYRWILVGIAFLNFGISLFVEDLIVPARCTRTLLNKLRRKKGPKNPYKKIQKDIKSDPHWPPDAENR